MTIKKWTIHALSSSCITPLITVLCMISTFIDISPRISKLIYCCCVSIIIVICICPPGALIWLINLFHFISFSFSMNMTDIRKASKNIYCRPNVHGIVIKKVHVFTFLMTNWTKLVRCFIWKNVYLLLCFTKDSTLYCNEHSKFFLMNILNSVPG